MGAIASQITSLTILKGPVTQRFTGLITAKTRQKVVSYEADDVVRVNVEFKGPVTQRYTA